MKRRMKKLLHVGCGQKTIKNTTKGFNDDSWIETRFDIDPKVRPDIIGSMTDMMGIGDGEFDALFSSHKVCVAVSLGSNQRIACYDLQKNATT